VAMPEELKRVITERQGDLDADEEETDLVRRLLSAAAIADS